MPDTTGHPICAGTIQQHIMKEPVRFPTPIHAVVAGFSGRAPDMAPFTTNGNVCCHQAMYIIAIIYKYKYMEINQSWYIYMVYFDHLHQVLKCILAATSGLTETIMAKCVYQAMCQI